jgi:hypothetical protein
LKKNTHVKAHNRKSPAREHHTRSISSTTKHASVNNQLQQINRLAVSCLIIGLALAAIDGAMIYNRTQASLILTADYTFCNQEGAETPCHTFVDSQMSHDKPVDRPCKCKLNFKLDDDIETDNVYIYYGLNNFHQNYRFLTQTKSHRQLSGDLSPTYELKFCLSEGNKTTLPCGQLANILFDDDFTLTHSNRSLPALDRYNIVIEGSRGYVFRNPSGDFDKSKYTKPPRWGKDLFSLDPSQQSNNGLENGPLVAWMTISVLDDFRKLYAILKPANNKLDKGEYTVEIDYRYGVHSTGGEKIIRIETLGQFGPINDGLIVALTCLSVFYIGMFLFIALVVWRKWVYFVRGPGHVP